MRKLFVGLAVLALALAAVPAMAINPVATANVSLTIPDYIDVTFEDNDVELLAAPTGQDTRTYIGLVATWWETGPRVISNLASNWVATIAVGSDAGAGLLKGPFHDPKTYTLPASAALSDVGVEGVIATYEGGPTGNDGKKLRATVIVTRNGLSDAAGAYSGTVTVTVTAGS